MEPRLTYEINMEEFNPLRADIGNLGADLKENTFPHLKHGQTSDYPRIVLKSKLTHHRPMWKLDKYFKYWFNVISWSV